MKFINLFIASVFMWLISNGQIQFPNRTAVQFVMEEWSIENVSFNGNAFDVLAQAEFMNENDTINTPLYYDGGSTWKFRFTGEAEGNWTFITQSTHSDLNGHSGSIAIGANNDPTAHGFLRGDADQKYYWQGSEQAIVPQYNMYSTDRDNLSNMSDEVIDSLIEEYLVGHGFTGFHVATVGGKWYDINSNTSNNGTSINSSMHTEPDIASFEALERLIIKTHAYGGHTHIWMWGDKSRDQVPERLSGGYDGAPYHRLLRYIAGRWGALPGWSMGYGFDLFEWVTEPRLTEWHDTMQAQMGWFHFLGGRANKNQLNQISEAMDYSSYEWHRPDYTDYVDHINERPEKPAFSEDRFRIRDEGRAKDYTEDETRIGLYESTMAGGIANIWGNLLTSTQDPYANKELLKTYSTFFFEKDRFKRNLIRDNSLSNSNNARILKLISNDYYILFEENTDEINIDLSDSELDSLDVIAVNTKLAYSEINLGKHPTENNTINLSAISDWILVFENNNCAETLVTNNNLNQSSILSDIYCGCIINSDGNISASEDVVFQANIIQLVHNFQVETGGLFSIVVGTCLE